MNRDKELKMKKSLNIIKSEKDLKVAFYKIQEMGCMNNKIAWQLSREVIDRAGINRVGKTVHHLIPIKSGITEDSILNLKNLKVIPEREHILLERNQLNFDKGKCYKKEHQGYRKYKRAYLFFQQKSNSLYSRECSKEELIWRKAKAFDDACDKLGLKIKKISLSNVDFLRERNEGK